MTTANSSGDATLCKTNPWPEDDVVDTTTDEASIHQHFHSLSLQLQEYPQTSTPITKDREKRGSKMLRRDSIDIVNETRGTPGKWIALILGAVCVVLGLRDIFFCGYFFESEREFREAVYGVNCQQGPHKMLVGFAGIGILFNGIQRISFALAKRVSDLSYSATIVLAWDCLNLYVVLSVDVVPMHYTDLCLLSLIYQGYLTVMAWEALDRRSRPILSI